MLNERNEKILGSKIRQEALIWYAMFPTGSIIIAAGAWYAAKNNLLGPVPPDAMSVWSKVEPFFWLGSAIALLIGAWIRVKLTTPEALNRMRIPQTGRFASNRRGASTPPPDLDEQGSRIWDLYNKITMRSFQSAGFLDAPAMVLLGFYFMNRTTWYLWFVVGYSLAVGLVFRPQGRKTLIESALKLQTGEKYHPIISE